MPLSLEAIASTTLRRCVSSAVVVRTRDGVPCMSLFNRFSVDNNPFLRRFVD
jgi:hypothetical protein